jgi:hypothetical protein
VSSQARAGQQAQQASRDTSRAVKLAMAVWWECSGLLRVPPPVPAPRPPSSCMGHPTLCSPRHALLGPREGGSRFVPAVEGGSRFGLPEARPAAHPAADRHGLQLHAYLPVPPGSRGYRPGRLRPAGHRGRGMLRGLGQCWLRRRHLQNTRRPLSWSSVCEAARAQL